MASALDGETVNVLVGILKDATAQVSRTDCVSRGTGFFVDADLLVTCGHVVGDADEVEVAPWGQQPRPGKVIRPDAGVVLPEDIDVVLVRVQRLPTDLEPTAVAFGGAPLEGRFHVVGFPREDVHEGDIGIEALPVEGGPRESLATKEATLLRLTAGIQLKKGLSGGAVLSEHTGAVVAVMQYSEDPDAALGGAAVPIDRALSYFPDLRRLAANPPAAAGLWRTAIGRVRWEALGKIWDTEKQFDVRLAGDRSRWQIGLNDEETEERSLHELGTDDEVAEVLYQWAQNRRARTREEVELLGRILSAALFPASVADRLPPPSETGEEPVLVRLHVDPKGTLADIPWEFATIPGKDPAEFIAARPGYAFTRVVPTAEPELTDSATSDSLTRDARILGIIVQPDAIVANMPKVPGSGNQLREWPSLAKLRSALEDTVKDVSSLTFDVLENPEKSDVQAALERSYDVIHYIGFGRRTPGMDSIALFDGDDDLTWEDGVEEMCACFGRCRPRLVVFEFAIPPLHLALEPLPPSVVGSALTAGAGAVICTRPVHPRQFENFNEILYAELGGGASIEEAVQKARDSCFQNKRVDFAGFGWFSLLTGQVTRSRVIAAPRPAGDSISERDSALRGDGSTRAPSDGGRDAFVS